MSNEYAKKVNDGFAVLDQAAALRRGARELPTAEKKKLEKLKKDLRESGSEASGEKEKSDTEKTS